MEVRRHCLIVAVLAWTVLVTEARADIYQWEWVAPADHSQGQRQSATVCPGGTGVNAVPGANLTSCDLTKAWLNGANLAGSSLYGSTLTDANMSQANLDRVNLYRCTVTNAVLDGATISEAILDYATQYGLTKEQLYSTGSYRAGNLRGIQLGSNNFSRWDFVGQDLTESDLSFCTLGSTDFAGAVVKGTALDNTTSRGFTKEQLYSTASYRAGDLTGIRLSQNDLSRWDFSGQNLAGGRFLRAKLADASLDGARINGADLGGTTQGGFVASQLYSTASYKAKDLSGVSFLIDDLSGWNLVGQNLTRAKFEAAVLNQTRLDCADTRGARELFPDLLEAAVTVNTILPDGQIAGLDLADDEALPIRDFDGNIAITVDNGMRLAEGAMVEILLADGTWGSTITLAGGFTPDLGGTLKLGFAPGIDASGLVGTTFDLFNWNDQLPAGEEFGQVVSLPGYRWDLSGLYTTGEVMLVAVPEPAMPMMLALGAMSLVRRRIERNDRW